MPAATDDPAARNGRTPLIVLFWVGVGVAPVAVGLLLLGQSNGPLRIAAVLAVLSVVLIGLSIALRGDAETVRQDLEESIFGEIDELHKDVRNDIATAARATHRAFGEKLQLLQGEVEALRGQLDATRAELTRSGPATVQGTREHFRRPDPARYDRGGHDLDEGTGQGLMYQAQQAGQYPDPAASGLGAARHLPSSGRQEEPAPAGGARSGGPRTQMSGGVVRHTETVQVTTRHTVVDPHADVSGAGNVYGGSVYGGQDADWSVSVPPATSAVPGGRDRRAAEPDEHSWADQRGGDEARGSSYRRGVEPGGEPAWSELRAGDRWASVHTDERGRELRMGERREVARADDTGTELRFEDRWAAVRQDDPRSPASRRGSHGQRDRDRGWEDGAGERGRRPALPPGDADTSGSWRQPSGSWHQGGIGPERELVRRGNRHREDAEYGYPPEGDVPRAGGARQLDFGATDDRWR